MSGPKNEGRAEGFLADCARIYLEWHERAQAVDTEGLLALYHVCEPQSAIRFRRPGRGLNIRSNPR